MKAFLERKPVRHPKVIWQAIEDEALLLKLDTGQVSVLNRIGGQVWELMDGDKKLGDIVSIVQQTYDIDQKRAEIDVEAFVQQLLDRDMLCWNDDGV